MMPLCTTETSSVMCGWAFASVGLPCVAQRVWPMPVSPSSGEDFTPASRLRSLPSARRRPSCPCSTVATPAESYPRYSRRFSASTSCSATGPLPRLQNEPQLPPYSRVPWLVTNCRHFVSQLTLYVLLFPLGFGVFLRCSRTLAAHPSRSSCGLRDHAQASRESVVVARTTEKHGGSRLPRCPRPSRYRRPRRS